MAVGTPFLETDSFGGISSAVEMIPRRNDSCPQLRSLSKAKDVTFSIDTKVQLTYPKLNIFPEDIALKSNIISFFGPLCVCEKV